MLLNTAGQSVGAQMVALADGTPFTGAVTVYVTGNGGTQAIGSVSSGVCVHEGNGYHSYAPSQAETNYAHVAYTFIATGAGPQTVQMYPEAGDAFTRLGAPAGASVSADIAAVKTQVAAIDAKTTTLPSDPADQSLIIAATDAIMTRLGAPAGASISADLVAAIAAIPPAVWSVVIEGTVTAMQSMRLQNGVLGGKSIVDPNASTTTFRDLGDTKDRIVASEDGAGSRSAVTRNLT
jgi:hypothetical protein